MRRLLTVVTTALVAAALSLPLAHAAPTQNPPPGTGSSRQACPDWGMYGYSPARTFSSDCPSAISPQTARHLTPLWTFKTDKTVTASPVVVDGRVFVGDWTGTMFALDAGDGALLWSTPTEPAPGAPFGPIVSSAAVADIGGRQLVVFGAGPRVYALDATDGSEAWVVYVGANVADEQTEVESSPVIWDGVVYVGFDVHNRRVEQTGGVRGGVLALDAATGDRLWYFNPELDNVESGCSSVWSSPALDVDAGLLYFATGNCPQDDYPWTPHTEAVTALRMADGTPVWAFSPHEPNRQDWDFGATPNLFRDLQGRRILGIGNKDANYYALDPTTGDLLWNTQVAEPGDVNEDFAIGGFIGSTAVYEGKVFGGTALGGAPYYHAMNASTAEVIWNGTAGPTYAASAVVNGVVFAGALDNELKAWDARTGQLLWAQPLAGPISSAPAIVGDTLFVGSGTSSSDACAKDTPIFSDVCFAAFQEGLGRSGAVHAFTLRDPGGRVAAIGGTGSDEILLSNEGNRLNAFDLRTLESQTVIHANQTGELGGEGWPVEAGGRDVNGQVCVDPTSPAHIVLGEDTNQPDPPPGWGYFRIDGKRVGELAATQVGKLTPTYLGDPDNFGCGFLPDGRLVTTAIGDRFPGQPSNGELILWFPPFDRTDVPYCKLDGGLATAGGILVDADGSILVAANRPNDGGDPGGIFRFTGDLPTGPDAAGGCGRTDASGAPLVDEGRIAREVFIASDDAALTPSSIVHSGLGTYYVSSVFNGTIAEYDAEGTFLRRVVTPQGPPADSSGTPFGMAVASDGSLYYADLGIVGGEAFATRGTVRRVRFADDGSPNAPEVLDAGLDFPDGLGLLVPPPPPAPTPPPAVAPTADALPSTGGGAATLGLGMVAVGMALRTRRRR